ncbi:MAG: hypothetical protein ACK5L9_22805, partial [Paracoccus sp. (in: a-proteobacteria)]
PRPNRVGSGWRLTGLPTPPDPCRSARARHRSGTVPCLPAVPFRGQTTFRRFAVLELPEAVGQRAAKSRGSSMRKWCDHAGLPNCSSHGLRKAICHRIAEIEGDVFMVMAVSGHHDLKEAQKYIDKHSRKAKADSAIESLSNGGNQERNLANHPAKFAIKSCNELNKYGK